jgi:hypothetical protein
MTEDSVVGNGYRARAGDSISRIVGTSSPQAIGNFMRVNNLTSDHVEVGRNYFVPDTATAYGDPAGLGQHALNQSNERIAAASRSEMQRELNRSASLSEPATALPVAADRLIGARRYRAILMIAYVMVGIATTVNLAGLMWATWHHCWRKR